ncbi:hypothetical protein PGH12_12060 [Chryseobacterium wangxinyae]|uniref:hypothetical protein n=1 Tax=Chryseobacterium sp. CY350 TaxID=2997336 RepID=UPI00226E09EF|nr:hypothetical protein [Chryseobacterium sp. CY350]MCY0976194.1 hypothetical protein [Chryseobacterium sp. CY350]WBZ94208.1 hypothetical protein PGH12_12060 [Chryseobacterium sp. CY350]
MSKRKLLIDEVFKQGKRESGKDAKSGIAAYLWSYFDDHFSPSISDKTFIRYYDAFIRDNKEINIDSDTLNKLSQYLGYNDFSDFTRTFVKADDDANKTTVKISVDQDEESLTEKLTNIIVNITNEQNFKMPEFMKQNGFGIVELAFVAVLLTGSFVSGNYKKIGIEKTLGLFGGTEPAKEKKCMYWDKIKYRLIDCEDDRPNLEMKRVDPYRLKYFKKITRKDTLTVENAAGKTWYSKYNGVVEFFTLDGEDPDNGRELRSSTAHIIEKYAGIQDE